MATTKKGKTGRFMGHAARPMKAAVVESTDVTRARKLPLPGPDVEVSIPLSMLPAYLELHNLQALTLGEVHDAEKRTGRRRLGNVVWVKRTKAQVNHADQS